MILKKKSQNGFGGEEDQNYFGVCSQNGFGGEEDQNYFGVCSQNGFGGEKVKIVLCTGTKMILRPKRF